MADQDPARGAPTPMSFNRLGPFYRLQRRLGLLTDADLAAGRRGVLFIALAWLPAIALALVQRYALNADHALLLLFDFSAYAFAIAIGAFVLMEQSSDRRMATLVGQFTARGIVRESSREGIAQARLSMERRTGSGWAELAILVLAYLISYTWLSQSAGRIEGGTWFGHSVEGVLQPTLAGWWVLLVSLPLYWFLLGRWLWRFVTWGLLLHDIAKCDLRLVATHPDRCGGLAFIGQYPKTYMLFVFAESTVISATVLKLVVHGGASLMSFKFALLGMLAFFAIAFVLPLFVFAPVLVELKRKGLAYYGALASQHNLAFEAKWRPDGKAGSEGSESGEGLLGEPDASSLADLAAGYELVKNMLAVPVTKESVAPLILAALVPMVCVAATQMPFKDIIGAVKGLILL